VVTGDNESEMANAAEETRERIAFYASTPAYRGVLELHGWGDLQPELTRLSKAGGWDQMGELIDDDMLHTFSVVGTPEEIGPGLKVKLADIVQRLSFYAMYDSDPAIWGPVRDAVRS
jgi:alkanesulfonate monooxygenase SsuD/methylene tetrahydromethanopterin reductase-like flavin-dependent oxidoreductase (luciferase family)